MPLLVFIFKLLYIYSKIIKLNILKPSLKDHSHSSVNKRSESHAAFCDSVRDEKTIKLIRKPGILGTFCSIRVHHGGILHMDVTQF